MRGRARRVERRRYDRSVFRVDADREVADELAFHLEMRTRELEAQGWTSEAARREALRHFGDLDRLREECAAIGRRRDRRRSLRMIAGDFGTDVRYALRQLRTAPGFAVAAILTLALGMGGTTAIFSVVEGVMLRPYAFREPGRVVVVEEGDDANASDVSAGNFVDWKEISRSFASMAALRWTNVNIATEESPEHVLAVQATHDFWDVFGVQPALGRTFTAEEDIPGRDGVVVLSDGLWRSRFRADSSIVGREIRLNGQPSTVLGVMPADFDPFDAGEALWFPAAFTEARRQMHDEHYLMVAARLAPGVTRTAAQREMDRVARVMKERFPQENARGEITVRQFSAVVVSGDVRARLLILLGAVGFVLLIACANVANLLLARGTGRLRELGVRAAIGAGQRRLVRQLLTESLVLSVLGALAGGLLGWAGMRALIAAAPPGVPRLGLISVDGTTGLFGAAIAVVSAVLCGAAPALRIVRRDLFGTLRSGGRGTVGGSDRARDILVAAEVALAFALLAGAGLLVRTAISLARDGPGYHPEGVLTALVTLPPTDYGDSEGPRRTFIELSRALKEQPDIVASALSSQVPTGPGCCGFIGLIPEGRALAVESSIQTVLRIVTPGYFGAMGIRLARGRDFDSRNVTGGNRVMVVSERFARLAWPDEDPIGRRVACCEGSDADPMWKTVIGVAADVKSRGPGREPWPEFYLPLAQAPAVSFSWIQNTLALVARSRGGEMQSSARAIRNAVASVAPGVPVWDVRSMEDRVRGSFATSRFNAQLLAVLGFMGLALAIVGIYGVVAYYAKRRTHEIGLRMALGASRRNVLALVTGQGILPVLFGLVIGGALAAASTRVLRNALFGVKPGDPITFVIVAAVLLSAAVLAALVPARQATRLDPGQILMHG